ncbi:hypothetical protein RN346_04475 [Halomonas sp. PAMB 3232]|uniref:DUF4376 domain-containing protein n=1 Tax=Halomonas sp. PAMB 3232 TaxID=3075221 RepID=UPI0028A1D7D3|nr:DUF4376 domain-containing protein [Halomonas sp. PAMB 3232]WNL39817.1 hypothetical protein RN346_04475 [Halomonas sp. PAMB 3232]
MPYLKIVSGKIVEDGLTRSRACRQVRSLKPNVSQPRILLEETLNDAGFFELYDTPKPDGDVVTQGEPELQDDGSWHQTWHVRDFSEDERIEQRHALLALLEEARKNAEAQGVVINGIRYSGDPSNRAALLEVVQFAREAGQKEFQSWKDSDGRFHPNHRLEDVEQALHAIALRRGKLIALEGAYQAQVRNGEIEAIDSLSWEV